MSIQQVNYKIPFKQNIEIREEIKLKIQAIVRDTGWEFFYCLLFGSEFFVYMCMLPYMCLAYILEQPACLIFSQWNSIVTISILSVIQTFIGHQLHVRFSAISAAECKKQSLHLREDKKTTVNHHYWDIEEEVIYSVWVPEKTSQQKFKFSLKELLANGGNGGVFIGTTLNLISPSHQFYC